MDYRASSGDLVNLT